MRWLAIVNPHARRLCRQRSRSRYLQQVSDLVDDIEHTQSPGHATLIARAAHHYDGVLVVGGDGTIFEVLAGMDRTRQRLAVVPAGGGNSLARELGVDSLSAALAALAEGRPTPVDLMAVTVESTSRGTSAFLSASTVTVGYVADVVTRAARLTRLGVAAYAIAATMTLPRRSHMRVMSPDHAVADCAYTGLVVNNTRYLANFFAFPDAARDDGRMDVAGQGAAWQSQLLHNLSMLTGVGRYDPVQRWQTTQLRVEFARPLAVVLDGELIADVSALTASCSRAALTCQIRAR